MSYMACSCCGVPSDRAKCFMCNYCDGEHGDQLEKRILGSHAGGYCDPWRALALMLVDDAHLCGTLELVPCAPTLEGGVYHVGFDLRVRRTPPPWERYACRMFARGERPGIGEVVQIAIAAFFGRPNRAEVRADIEREVLRALAFLDPDIIDVQIKVTGNDRITRADEVRIEITKRTNIEPGAVMLEPTVEIPDHVLAQKPALA